MSEHSILRWLWEWTKSIVVALLVWFVLRTFLVEAFRIPSGSMKNTLLVGDFLFVNKALYGAEVPFVRRTLPAWREPRRGEILVFDSVEDPALKIVKRLVGVPGDTLEMRNGILLRNHAPVPEGYALHTAPDIDPVEDRFRWQRDYVATPTAATIGYYPSRNNWGPLVVPEKNYFVLGDNRDNSSDSRYWGFVADSLVKGRPFVIYYSYAPDSAQGLAWLTRIRWNRLGERVR